MNLDRFDHPLRLAKGSHRPESGKGCAMNVVSYINGDSEITDFPACSARPLAAFVQSCNDLLAGPDGYLSPENSLLALELAWQTVGTADVADIVIHAWVAELLASPRWGVVRYAKNAAVEAIFDIAELHRKAASGDMPPIAAWDAAQRAAGAAARAIDPTSDAGGLHAVRAAHQSTAIIDTDHWVKLDAVTGHALRAHELVAGEGAATHIVALTRRAIRSWRHLAGLANPSQASCGKPTRSPEVLLAYRRTSNCFRASTVVWLRSGARIRRCPQRQSDRSTPTLQQKACGSTNSSTPDKHASER
jgi:hypothetical protein